MAVRPYEHSDNALWCLAHALSLSLSGEPVVYGVMLTPSIGYPFLPSRYVQRTGSVKSLAMGTLLRERILRPFPAQRRQVGSQLVPSMPFRTAGITSSLFPRGQPRLDSIEAFGPFRGLPGCEGPERYGSRASGVFWFPSLVEAGHSG